MPYIIISIRENIKISDFVSDKKNCKSIKNAKDLLIINECAVCSSLN